MKNYINIILFLMSSILVLSSCANLSSNAGNNNSGNLPKDPKEIKISWYKDGGMLPEYSRIYISNDSCSYLSSKQNIEQIVKYQVSNIELKALYDVFYNNEFNKIQTFEEEIYDRGGSSISLTADTQSFSISNSGMTLIKENNQAQYANIEKAILNLNKAYVNKQKQTILIDLDTSITNYKNNVTLYVNDNIVYSEEKNGEYFTLELELLPINNSFQIYFMEDGNNPWQEVDKRFEFLLEQLPLNNNILLTLEDNQLIVK